MTIFQKIKRNQESEITNISVALSETKDLILPAIPSNSKLIFPFDRTPLTKVLFKDAKIFVEIQEKLNGLIYAFEDNMSSFSNDIGYIKLIDMDIEINLIYWP